MNVLVLTVFAIVCIMAVESRYPYEDGYRSGDVVPHGYDDILPYDRSYSRRTRGGLLGRKRYDRTIGGYGYSREYQRRRNQPYLPPRGIGGYNRKYDNPDYDFGGHRRQNSRGPLRYYDDEELYDGGRSDRQW